MSDPLIPGAVRPTALDRLDPRSRVLAAVAGCVVAVTLHDPAVLIAALLSLSIGAMLAGVSLAGLGRRLRHVEGFLVVLVVLLPFTVPGRTAFMLGPLEASEPGLDRAVLVLLRVNLAAVVVFTFLAGLEPVRLGHALVRLGCPARLVHVLLFAVRFVDELRGEAARLRDAMRARAFRPIGLGHLAQSWGNFAGQLLVRAFERAERVGEAMRCRGFAGHLLVFDESRFTGLDRLAGLGLGAAFVLLLVADRLP